VIESESILGRGSFYTSGRDGFDTGRKEMRSFCCGFLH
jgi:hypothetical protein